MVVDTSKFNPKYSVEWKHLHLFMNWQSQRTSELEIAGFDPSAKTSAFCFYKLIVLAVSFHFNVILQNFQVSNKTAVWFSFAEA